MGEHAPQIGQLDAIVVAPVKRQPSIHRDRAVLLAGYGIEGDHHAARDPGNARQVTLIQAEHLAAIGSMAGLSQIHPESLRRNLVVRGINLLALRRFRVGTAVLEATGPCDPCSRMDDALGAGGCAAMTGHGGITARVVVGGEIALGDAVSAVDEGAV